MNPQTPTGRSGPPKLRPVEGAQKSSRQGKGEEDQQNENGSQFQHGMLVGDHVYQGNNSLGNFFLNPYFLRKHGYGFLMPEMPMSMNYVSPRFNSWNTDIFDQPVPSYTPFDFNTALSRVPEEQPVLGSDTMSSQRQKAELAFRFRSPTSHPSQSMDMFNFAPSPFTSPYPPPSPYTKCPALMALSTSGPAQPLYQHSYDNYNNLPLTASSPLFHSPKIPTPTYDHQSMCHFSPPPPPPPPPQYRTPSRPQTHPAPKDPREIELSPNAISPPKQPSTPRRFLFPPPPKIRRRSPSPSQMSNSFSIPSSTSSPSMAPDSPLTPAPRMKVDGEKKEESQCWACGKQGHDMMDCMAGCAHCGEAHKTIMCKYKTLEGGQRVLMSEVQKPKEQGQKLLVGDIEMEEKDIRRERQVGRPKSPENKRQHPAPGGMVYNRPRGIKEMRGMRGRGYASRKPSNQQEKKENLSYRERDHISLRGRARGVSKGSPLKNVMRASSPNSEGSSLEKDAQWMGGNKPPVKAGLMAERGKWGLNGIPWR